MNPTSDLLVITSDLLGRIGTLEGLEGGGVKYFRGSVFITHSYIIALLPPPSPTTRQRLPLGSNDQAKKEMGGTQDRTGQDRNRILKRIEPNLEQPSPEPTLIYL